MRTNRENMKERFRSVEQNIEKLSLKMRKFEEKGSENCCEI